MLVEGCLICTVEGCRRPNVGDIQKPQKAVALGEHTARNVVY